MAMEALAQRKNAARAMANSLKELDGWPFLSISGDKNSLLLVRKYR
jgi:hypothetical protein